jgi:RNA polymerase sigma-70 factor (ECF subfamily)
VEKNEIVELAERAIKGDRDAFEDICREKRRNMIFVAMTILGNYEDAEDAAHEAIIKMYKGIGKLRDPAAINAWIERIVRNESITLYRSKANRRDDVDIEDEDISLAIADDDRDFLPEAYIEDSQLRENLYRTVMSLSLAKREAVIMYYYEGLSYKEIAEITGTSPKTVSTNLMKARIALKKKLTNPKNEANAAVLGESGTATTLGKALAAQSVSSVSDAKLALFDQKWLASIKGVAVSTPVKAGFLKGLFAGTSMKIAVATIALVSVTATSAVVIDGAHDIAPPVQTASAREIVFYGNDCECGHINPYHVDVSDISEGDGDPIWEIQPESGGAAIFTGSSSEVDAELKALAAEDQDGGYILKCKFPNKNNGEVALERTFVIGDYKGDAS